MPAHVMLCVYWLGFLGTTIWGHVGIKAAIRHDTPFAIMADIASVAGLSAVVAWTLSVGFWALIVAEQSLTSATTMANVRYPLICLAAVWYFEETLDQRQICGMVVMLAGLIIFGRGPQLR